MNRREHALDVLDRVAHSEPLSNADREPVLSLIGAGFMHVNPVHIAGEACPYRLTDTGQAVVATRRFPKKAQDDQPEAPAPIQGGAMFGKDFRDPATWPESLRPS